MYLRQSTIQTVRVGPFYDDTDFKTLETALTIAQADRQISKDGGAFAQTGTTGNATHDTDGWYSFDLSAADTNTCGILELQITVAGALQVWKQYYVVEEAIYDALFAASAAGFDSNQRVNVGSWLGTAVTVSATTNKPEVDVNSVSDDATAANNLELDYDGTGYNKSNSTIGTATTLTDLGATAKTSVNTEVSDVLKTDTIAEQAQGAPPATPTFEEAIMYLYMALRNRNIANNSSGFLTFENDAGTVIWKKAISDDGTSYTEAEGQTGP